MMYLLAQRIFILTNPSFPFSPSIDDDNADEDIKDPPPKPCNKSTDGLPVSPSPGPPLWNEIKKVEYIKY